MRQILTILLLIIFGCNPAKKVLKNNEAFEQVGRAWAAKNPCVNDSIFSFLPGTIDSVPFVLKQMDTALLYHITDSLTLALAKKYGQDVKECNRQVSDAFNYGYRQAIYDASLLKTAVKSPDTLKISVIDKRSLKACEETNTQIQGQLTNTLQAIAKMTTQRNLAYIIIGVLGLALTLITIILFKK